MPEILDEAGHIESTTLAVDRTSTTVKGGRRFSFGALVVVGDRRGRVGFGYGKSKEVPAAVEKAQKYAKRDMKSVPMIGATLPHQIEGRFSSAKVRLLPASPGTGVVAGATVRSILELAGITDCLTKCYGSTNKINVVKAVFDAVTRLRAPERIGAARGQDLGMIEIQTKIEKSKRFMPSAPKREKAKGPVNVVGDDRRGGRGGRGGGGRGRGGPRGGGGGGGGGDRGGGHAGAPQHPSAPAGSPAADGGAAPAPQ